jgi:hypothetical protein
VVSIASSFLAILGAYTFFLFKETPSFKVDKTGFSF